MSRSTTSSAAAGLAALAALGLAPAAGAAPTPGPERALEALCAGSGGTLVDHPFQRVRCQLVPASTMRDPLLQVAESLCEHQLGAIFGAAPSFGSEDGSITWICA